MSKNHFKKTKVLILALLLSLSGETAFAAANSTESASTAKNPNQAECKNHRGRKHHGIQSILKEQLGLSKEDIKNAKKSGKTVFDLAKEKKGLSADQVRNIIITEKNKSIDKAVSDGKITKEKAVEIKAKIKDKITKWDGSFKKDKCQ